VPPPVVSGDGRSPAALPLSAAEVEAAGAPAPVPLVVLTAVAPGCEAPPELAALARLSPRGRAEVVEGSGHWIQLDRPERVVAAIRAVVEEARAEKSA
jgi:pimeloyl-ACP methyl ester carboxylesterase